MKIGYLMQSGVPEIRRVPYSGAAKHVRNVITALKANGHQVSLLARLDGNIWRSDNLIDYQNVSIGWMDRGTLYWVERIIRRLQYKLHLPFANLFDSLRFAVATKRELADCDLLYERFGWMGYGGGLAAKSLRVPHVLEVNGDYDELQMLGIAAQGFQRWLEFKLMNSALHRASHIVASGDGWRYRVISRWKIDPDKVTTVQNGSELVNYLSRDQLWNLRQWNIKEENDQPVSVIYLGGSQPWQGLQVLIPAFAKAMECGINARLTLVGSGPEMNKVQELVNDMNLKELVQFYGHMPLERYAPLLSQASIGVAPYCGRVEFSGLKLLDYKAAGLAIIVSGENDQPAVITHGLTGWIVPPCDPSALAEAIIMLSKNPEQRKYMGRNARIEAENLHTWEKTVDNLEQIFLKIVNN